MPDDSADAPALAAARDDFLVAAAAVRDLVRRIPDDAWDGPGLGEWDLRALVGHTSRSLVTVHEYLRRPAERIEIGSAAAYFAVIKPMTTGAAVVERGRQAGRTLGERPAAPFAELCDTVADDLAGATDEIVECIVGGIRLRNYLPTRTFELAVHGLDIADATALPYDPPARVIASALVTGAQVAQLLGVGETLLRAITGRATLPPGFCIV